MALTAAKPHAAIVALHDGDQTVVKCLGPYRTVNAARLIILTFFAHGGNRSGNVPCNHHAGLPWEHTFACSHVSHMGWNEMKCGGQVR